MSRAALLAREILVEPTPRGTFMVACYLAFVLVTNDLVTQVVGRAAVVYGAQKDLALLVLIWHGIHARVWRQWSVLVAVGIGLILAGCILGLDRTTTLTAAAYGLRNSYTGLVLLLAVPCILSPRYAERLLDVLNALATAASVLAVVTWSFGVRWLALVVEHSAMPPYFVTGGLWPRAFSPFVSPVDLAVVAAVGIAVVIVRWRRVLGLPPWAHLIPMTGAIGCSLSRSAMLATAAVAVLMLLPHPFRRRMAERAGVAPRPVLVAVLLAMATFFTLRASTVPMLGWTDVGNTSPAPSSWQLKPIQDDPSWQSHGRSVTAGVDHLTSAPRGLGVGNVGQRARRFVPDGHHVESSILLVGLEAGVVGLIGLGLVGLGLMGSAARRLVHRRATAPDTLLLLVLVAMGPTFTFLPLIQDIGAMWTCWLVVAAAVASQRAVASGPSVSPSSPPA
jgi:hypothetical protein